MSIPVHCNKCGAMIGSLYGMWLNPYFRGLSTEMPRDSGPCNHQEPQRTEGMKFFGWIKKVCIDYPETETSSSWVEYYGPSSKFILWLVIIFTARDGILINGKWAWWDSSHGFFGEGIKELEKLQMK